MHVVAGHETDLTGFKVHSYVLLLTRNDFSIICSLRFDYTTPVGVR